MYYWVCFYYPLGRIFNNDPVVLENYNILDCTDTRFAQLHLFLMVYIKVWLDERS